MPEWAEERERDELDAELERMYQEEINRKKSQYPNRYFTSAHIIELRRLLFFIWSYFPIIFAHNKSGDKKHEKFSESSWVYFDQNAIDREGVIIFGQSGRNLWNLLLNIDCFITAYIYYWRLQ